MVKWLRTMKLKLALAISLIPFLSLSIKGHASDRQGQVGLASWYGSRHHGVKTASGERFNMYDFTAAHRSLPMGTRVRVINLRTGKEVIVRINDRGPFKRTRIIDLSRAAAKAIGLIRSGVARVKLEVMSLN